MKASSPKQKKTVVAAFDFDGTITTRDTLVSFLLFVAGTWPTVRKLAKLTPIMLGFLFKSVTRQKAKEEILKSFFAGMPSSQLREMGEAFARSPTLQRLVRPAALKRLAWHKSQKHKCILISASIDAYVEPWGKRVGFDHVICSQLETTPQNTITGHLVGANCWGPEKIARLESVLGPLNNVTLYAYGDSRGDQELLAAAEFPFYRQLPHPK